MSNFLLSLDVATPGSLTLVDRTVGLDQRNKEIDQNDLASIRSNALFETFYTREDLLDLLNQPDSAGIRIYPALDPNGRATTLAVATNSKRADIVKGDRSKCFVSNGFDPASRITEKQGIDVVAKYNEHLFRTAGDLGFALGGRSSRRLSLVNYSKVFFTSGDILGLMSADSKGVRFYTTQIKFNDSGRRSFPTLTAVEVNNNEVENSIALLSALPCPPNCGGGYTGETLTDVV